MMAFRAADTIFSPSSISPSSASWEREKDTSSGQGRVDDLFPGQ
jgi:hypothetical protein